MVFVRPCLTPADSERIRVQGMRGKRSGAAGGLAGDLSRTGNRAQTKRKGPVSRTLRQVLPCGFPLGLALRLALEGISLRSFLLISNLPIGAHQCKRHRRYESAVCGNKQPIEWHSVSVPARDRQSLVSAARQHNATPPPEGSGKGLSKAKFSKPKALQITYFRPMLILNFQP